MAIVGHGAQGRAPFVPGASLDCTSRFALVWGIFVHPAKDPPPGTDLDYVRCVCTLLKGGNPCGGLLY